MFSHLGREALRIVLPSWCVACDGPLPWRDRVASCCASCWAALPKITTPKCVSCAVPLEVGDGTLRCLECELDPLPVEWCEAWGSYGGSMERLLHAFKFRRHDFLADALGGLLHETLTARGDAGFDAIVPVPMHRAKLRQRGYNQAELLAVELGRRTGIAVERKLLEKIGERETQSRLPRERRAANVRGVFRARAAGGRSILLVDDITTTGATLRECAKVLLGAGASRVCALTLAKVS